MNEIVIEWISKAEEDWRVASREIEVIRNPSFGAVCYHAQQCAEKFIKAMLIFKNIRPEFSHDLIKLSNKFSEVHNDWNYFFSVK
jgi:HEPN domain-containing protein